MIPEITSDDTCPSNISLDPNHGPTSCATQMATRSQHRSWVRIRFLSVLYEPREKNTPPLVIAVSPCFGFLNWLFSSANWANICVRVVHWLPRGHTSPMAVTHTHLRRLPALSLNPRLIILNLGPIFVWCAVAASLLTQVTASSINIGPLPALLALVALAFGIPHGAADNLTMVHSLNWQGWVRLAVTYLSIAGAAALLIIAVPTIGFVLVLAMTVWHFGTGDVEATQELQGRPPITGKFRVLYALALGSAPVLLPLTSPSALSTLVSLEPRLAAIYSSQVTTITRAIVLTLIVGTIVALIDRGDLRGAFELFTLAILGLVVSPLIAFAIYFGFWHAVRHTARLAQITSGTVSIRSLAGVTKVGVPSLIGFNAILTGLTIFFGTEAFTGTVLWIALALVWGLTVPHMWFVTRFDNRIRAERSGLTQGSHLNAVSLIK